MRRILVDHARRHLASRRGDGFGPSRSIRPWRRRAPTRSTSSTSTTPSAASRSSTPA
jgi:hypothetical protein